ncbi:tRNA (guanosine(37)-N1)-methyltransferase TrmD [Candidatus Curtissbacteria bacterium]|nr:tRNA (guanosine(37)-N1)-methyltransferase TrmD [Candidatus Curtissbacteria bacterium]
MKFYIVTLFPEIFPPVLNSSILKRAQARKLISFSFINPRDFTSDNYHTVDDKPYGGGPGMVMKVEPIVKSLESIPGKPYKILLSASGQTFTQQKAKRLKAKSEIVLICGHYEGVDARVEDFVDEIISIGDFVLTGGEIAALAIVDSLTRLLPGAINIKSPQKESFSKKTLEHEQYTRPEVFRHLKVPKVLLAGNHKEIENWREKQSVKRTKKFHADLLK